MLLLRRYMPYPCIRRAKPEDYDAIWEIWMQEHIIQWMSFTPQTKEAFKAHYDRMAQSSDIYVLVDKIEGKKKVVGVRRIKYGKDHYKHTAEYCSMGIHEAHQGKGYAKFFYEEFEKIVRAVNGITRIQLTQSGGNNAAFHLVDKNFSFSEEAVFPNWLQQHLIERYVYRLLDKELATMIAPGLPSLKYEEVVPPLQAINNDCIVIKQIDYQYIAYLDEKPLLTVDFEPDNSVIKHIAFLAITLHKANCEAQATLALQKILTAILQEGRVKKVELFSAEPAIAELCRSAGFFVRGEKIASYYDDKDGYKNELGMEYSFFTIKDAENLIAAKITNAEKRDNVAAVLSRCSTKIKELIANKTCDGLGANYLENVVYQIVRDSLEGNKVFSLADKRWQPLIKHLPQDLILNLRRLQNRLKNDTPTLFDPNLEKQSTTFPAASSQVFI